MKIIIPFLFIVLLPVASAFAQGGKKNKKEETPRHWDSPTRDPDAIFKGPEKSQAKKTKVKSKNSNKRSTPVDAAMVRYEQQKKENARKYAKMAKEMEKPQYSDPSYFGHKKKPKKRPVNKRKFCHECGIVH